MLSSGLIPLVGKKNEIEESYKVNKKTTSKNDDFDVLFDEILDSPSPVKQKRGGSKKTGKRHSPTRSPSPLGKLGYSSPSDALSPQLGDSTDNGFEFNPSGIASGANLDDSIIGGLIGTGSKINKIKKDNHVTDTKSSLPLNSTSKSSNTLNFPSQSNNKDSSTSSSMTQPIKKSSHHSSPNTFDDSFDAYDDIDSATKSSKESLSLETPAPLSRGRSNWDDMNNDLDVDIDMLLGEIDAPSAVSKTTSNITSTKSSNVKFSEVDYYDDGSKKEQNRSGTYNTANITQAFTPKASSSSTLFPTSNFDNSSSTTTSANSKSSFSNDKFSTNDSLNSNENEVKLSDAPLSIPLTKSVTDKTGYSSAPSQNASKNDDLLDIGFVPSFLDSGREPRSKRQLGRSRSALTPRSSDIDTAQSDNNAGGLDALDKALGLKSSNNKVNDSKTFTTLESVTPKMQSTSAKVESTSDIITDITPKQNDDLLPSAVSTVSNQISSKKTSSTTVGLPSLISPNKGYVQEQEKSNSDETFTKSQINDRIEVTAQENFDQTNSNISKKRYNSNSNISSLTIQIDSPSDVPLSNPPTYTLVTSSNISLESSISEPESNKDKNNKLIESTAPTSTNTTSSLKKQTSIETISPANLYSSTPSKDQVKRDSSTGIALIRSPNLAKYQQQNDSPLKTISSNSGSTSVPTWLSSSVTSSSINTNSNSDSRHLLNVIDEVTMQKDAIEKYLRLEIESLKSKLSSESNNYSNNEVNHVPSENIHQNCTATIEDLKSKITALTIENMKLKEEASVEHMIHQKELTHLRDRHSADMDAGNARMKEEIEMIERRHIETVTSLKKLHQEELAAVKQRSKDGAALEQLTNQLKSSSGALKLIEEQLSQRYTGMDVIREGQFEARERLVHELEEGVKSKLELAESEQYRLKGLVLHMEQLLSSMRGQGSEERERLKYEHRRLEAAQTSLEEERKMLHLRIAEESAELRAKANKMQEDHREEVRSICIQQSELAEAKSKLELDRKEFSAYVASSVKAAELSALKLKEEEKRLLKMKEDVINERNMLEKQKQESLQDLQNAAMLRQSIKDAFSEIEEEKLILSRTASDLQNASESLLKRDKELEESRRHLQEEKMRITQSLSLLENKEKDVAALIRHRENQFETIKSIEEEMANKKLAIAMQRKELVRVQNDINKVMLSNTDVNNPSMDKRENYSHSYNARSPGSYLNTHSSANQQDRTRFHPNNTSNGVQDSHKNMQQYNSENFAVRNTSNQSNQPAFMDVVAVQKEIESAKKTMHAARTGLVTATSSRLSTASFIRNENEFLSKIRRNKNTA